MRFVAGTSKEEQRTAPADLGSPSNAQSMVELIEMYSLNVTVHTKCFIFVIVISKYFENAEKHFIVCFCLRGSCQEFKVTYPVKAYAFYKTMVMAP